MINPDPPPGGLLPFKVALTIMYVTFAYQIIERPLTLGANLSLGSSISLFVLHVYAVYYYWDLIQRAPGNRFWNGVGIFVFGIFQMAEMKRALWESRQTTDEISRLLREGL